MSKEVSKPSSGARQVKGKSNDCDENLRFADKKKPEEVKTLPVESDNDDHYKAMEAQNNGNVVFGSLSREESIAEGRKAINRENRKN